VQKYENQRKLEEIQERMENNEVLPNLLKQEQTVYQKYVKSLKDEESMWRLKSRCPWLQDGDKNTSFFVSRLKLGNGAIGLRKSKHNQERCYLLLRILNRKPHCIMEIFTHKRES
jgi:hypothetical protein